MRAFANGLTSPPSWSYHCTWILFFVIQKMIMGYNSTDMWDNVYGNPLIFVLCALAGCGSIILLSCKISICTNYLCFLGKNTIYIYGLHSIINEFLLFFESKMLIIKKPIQYLLQGIVNLCIILFVITIGIKFMENKRNKLKVKS